MSPGLNVSASAAIASIPRHSAARHFSVLTPAELDAHCSRVFPNACVADVVDAFATAFVESGYGVTECSVGTGVVMTTPRKLSLTAAARAGYASGAEDRLAWWVLVSGVSAGVEVRMIPCPYRGTREAKEYVFVAEIMEPTIAEIWREVAKALTAGRRRGPRGTRAPSRGR